MEHINKFISNNIKYKRYEKPLRAANVCNIARKQADGRFGVISFRQGLLRLSVKSSPQAASLRAESEKIIAEINKEIGNEAVKEIRFKIE